MLLTQQETPLVITEPTNVSNVVAPETLAGPLVLEDEAQRAALLSDRATPERKALREADLPNIWAPSEQVTAGIVDLALRHMEELDTLELDQKILRAVTTSGTGTVGAFDLRARRRHIETGMLQRRLDALLDRLIESAGY